MGYKLLVSESLRGFERRSRYLLAGMGQGGEKVGLGLASW